MTQAPPEGPAAGTRPSLPRRTGGVRTLVRVGRRAVALVVVLVIAGLLRFYNLNWDEGLHLHPDERYVAYLATLIKPVWSAEAYFDSGTSPLNPFNTDWGSRYVYGTLPLFGPRYLAEWLDQGCGQNPNPMVKAVIVTVYGADLATCSRGTMVGFDRINLVGRSWSAVTDLLSILTLYLIGRRLFGWRAGLLAASLDALAVLQIQQSHFFTVDATANLFVNLCLLFCANMSLAARRTVSGPARVRWPHLALNGLLAGVSAGCAVASKISAWPLVPMIVLAALIHFVRDRRPVWRGLASATLAVALAGAGAFAAFRVTQPYSFVGSSAVEFQITLQRCLVGSASSDLIGRLCEIALSLPEPVRVLVAPSARWLENLGLASMFVNGTVDVPFGHQWANRPPITFPLVNLVFWGMGIALGLAAMAGLAYAARRLLLGRRWWAYAIPVVWVFAYFVYQGSQYTKSMRYLLPIYPLACLLAAVAISRAPRIGRVSLRIPLTALVLGATVVWSAAFMSIYREPITRATASRWIYDNVPTAVTVTYQEDGRDKSTQLPVQSFRTSLGLPQTFWITPEDLKARGSMTWLNARLTFNHTSGEALVTARVVDTHLATSVSQASLDTQTTLSADRPTLSLGTLTFLAGHEYHVEVSQLAGPGFSARASIIANEQWDDPLPQALDGRYGFSTHFLKLLSSNDGQMQPYNEDVPESPGAPGKLAQMLSWLDEADYLVMSSNRIYASVPRLPWRFPLTTEYYRALFAGELGFELAADFHSFPRLGDFQFNSQEMPQPLSRVPTTAGPRGVFVPYPSAEEAFSVYDHPRVLIFRKTERYSRALAESNLGTADLTRTFAQTPLMAVNTPRGMLLDDTARAAQQSGGTWTEVFPPEAAVNQSQAIALLAWLLLIEAVGLGAFPILVLIFRTPHGGPAFADGGYAFAKVIGLLLAAFSVWQIGSARLVPVTADVARLALAGVVAMGVLAAIAGKATIVAVVRSRWRVILAGELIFLLGFLAFALIRSGNPDLWHPFFGGEKPMDLAYLTATIKSTSYPPYDPWFSGGYINYYYFGFILVGVPIKALGIEPGVAYNLAIPALYGLTAAGAYGAATTLYSGLRGTSRAEDGPPQGTLVAGALAALLVVGVGNIDSPSVLYTNWLRLGGGPELDTPTRLRNGIFEWLARGPANFGWQHYWNPTRLTAREMYPVDALPIAEFPLFTFLYADLHAHMMAMPLALAGLGMAGAFARGVRRWPAVALAAVTIGALWPTNTWDYPIYAALAAAGLIGGVAALAPSGHRIRAGMRALPLVGAFLLGTRVAFIPYLENYGTAYNSLVAWTGERTPIWPYWVVYALFVIPLAGFGLRALAQQASGWTRSERIVAASVSAGAALCAASFALAGIEAGLVAIPMLAMSALLILGRQSRSFERGVWIIVAGAFGLTLIVELFTLKGDIGRMNTVFKFYIQAWLLLGACTGALVADGLAQRSARPDLLRSGNMALKAGRISIPRAVFVSAAAVTLFLAALYPAFAIPAKIADRYAPEAPAGLDGLAYMRYATRQEGPGSAVRSFPLIDDYESIRWMQRSVAGSPVILEGNTGGLLYRWGDRFSIYTGLPTVIGWDWHQRQQRSALPDRLVYERESDVATFYNTEALDDALTILRRYNIAYVIVGDLERAYYAPRGIEKIARMVSAGYLRLAYGNEGTQIYAVVE